MKTTMNGKPLEGRGNDVQVGNLVRSFDFESRDLEGDRACYVEGFVIGLVEMEGCMRYHIVVERRVFGGKVLTGPNVEKEVFPPVNGTASWLGRPIDVVEVLA